MKLIEYPSQSEWPELIMRPVIEQEQLIGQVSHIMEQVKTDGDIALKALTLKFDGVQLDDLKVADSEIKKAKDAISMDLKKAIDTAYKNITKFHRSQISVEPVVETMPGVKCWRQSTPIEQIGFYIPGGSAPLFSTVLMLGVPAQIAGCKDIQICTPPNKLGQIESSILYAAGLVGVDKVFKLGGAQAIAAMTYGTKSIDKVYKIFGPGNQFVTQAKALAQQHGVSIDMPAGPSEVLIVADKTCQPVFVAADLLSQAEHGEDSQVLLLVDDQNIAKACLQSLAQQLIQLPRKDIAKAALKNSKIIVCKDIKTCMAFSNFYAPEHLIIASDQAQLYVDDVVNAGSVFLGNYSCESAGDYASGTNHTLPTNGFAKNYSGVSVDSFVKKITFQEITKAGLQNIGSTIETMAKAESLMAHKNAVSIRLKK